jgi:imidazolonepropionase-like amidohydrolase
LKNKLEAEMARLALTGATLMTATRGNIDNGTLVIRNSTIAEIGTNIGIPRDSEVWDLKGKVVIPGMIDAHTHLGLRQDGVGPEQSDEDEVENPIVPHIRAIDAINPEDIGFSDALKGGVTTVGVMPGSYNVVCGQPAAVKVVGRTLEEMLVSAPVGMKISFGERPKGAYGNRKKSPMTRMGISAILREALIKTHNYMKRKGERDLRMESLIPVIKKTIPFRAHAHRADDIMTAMRIAKEFSVRLVIEHGTDGYKVAAELAAAKVPVVHGPWIKVRGNVEQSGRNPESPRILIENGVLTSFSTDHPVIAIQNMRFQATHAVEEGVSENEALKAITINSALIMGIEKRVGSLEKGKDADLVILSGPPFAGGSKVEAVVINGMVAWKH